MKARRMSAAQFRRSVEAARKTLQADTPKGEPMSLFAKLAILAEYYIRNLDSEAPPGFGHHVLCGVVLRHLKDSDEEEEGEEEGNGWILEVTAEFPEGGHASCTVKYTLNIPADLPFSAVVDRLYAEIPQQAAA